MAKSRETVSGNDLVRELLRRRRKASEAQVIAIARRLFGEEAVPEDKGDADRDEGKGEPDRER